MTEAILVEHAVDIRPPHPTVIIDCTVQDQTADSFACHFSQDMGSLVIGSLAKVNFITLKMDLCQGLSQEPVKPQPADDTPCGLLGV